MKILSKITDNEALLIQRLKAIFDWILIEDILNGNSCISSAKVADYEQHKEDLSWLKSFIRKHCKDKYNELFRDNDTSNNYAAYRQNYKSAEAFFKNIQKILKNIEPDEDEKIKYNDALERIENGRFLPKQVTSDNRVIPYQLYWHELDEILKNAQNYLPFLNEKDESGISNADKIRSIFEFRVPYFVGPLNKYSDKAWIIRKKEGKIYPWNIKDMVDYDASENEFIRRMTGKCTYLLGEDVLPKNSLCYHRFMVLNEINNMRINNERISVELKQELYSQLFMHNKKVTRKKLENYLISHGYFSEDTIISGIDEQIHSDLSPQFDLKKFIENSIISENEAEEIILRITTTDSRKRLEKWLSARFDKLEDSDIRYISGLRYKDFGRLSERFLNELEGTDLNTGEVTTIMYELAYCGDNKQM